MFLFGSPRPNFLSFSLSQKKKKRSIKNWLNKWYLKVNAESSFSYLSSAYSEQYFSFFPKSDEVSIPLCLSIRES